MDEISEKGNIWVVGPGRFGQMVNGVLPANSFRTVDAQPRVADLKHETADRGGQMRSVADDSAMAGPSETNSSAQHSQ